MAVAFVEGCKKRTHRRVEHTREPTLYLTLHVSILKEFRGVVSFPNCIHKDERKLTLSQIWLCQTSLVSEGHTFKPYPQLEHDSFSAGDSEKRALFIHGFPGTPYELRGLAEALLERGWQVSVPLLPGFGKDIIHLAHKNRSDWLRKIRDEYEILKKGSKHMLLVGFSMGGALSLTSAVTLKPDQLILLAPFSKLPDWREKLLPVVKYVLPELRPFEKADFNDSSVIAEFKKMLPYADLTDVNIQTRLRKLVTLRTESLIQLREVGKLALANAPKVPCSCVVIQGTDDKTVIVRYTQRLVGQFKTKPKYIEIPGGHEFTKTVDLHYPTLKQVFLEHVLEP
jgi:esterase/lipase